MESVEQLARLMQERKVFHITVQGPTLNQIGAMKGWKANLRVNAGWHCGIYCDTLSEALDQVFGLTTSDEEIELDLEDI